MVVSLEWTTKSSINKKRALFVDATNLGVFHVFDQDKSQKLNDAGVV